MEVRYTDSIDKIDSFDITLNNWDDDERDFKYTGSARDTSEDRSDVFEPGQKIELWMGYSTPTASAPGEMPESMQLMLVGIITKLAPDFPGTRSPTLKVSGQNVLRQLLAEQETHVYGPQITDSGIAEKIDKRGNLKIDDLKVPIRIDAEAKAAEKKYEHVLQDNQYDILFLLQRAHLNGYDVLLKYEQNGDESSPYLYFGPARSESRVSCILEWGKSLIRFQPTLTTTNQVGEVVVRGWNAARKERIEVTVSRDELNTRSIADRERLRRIEQGFRERKEIIVDRPFRDTQEARRYALARLGDLSRDMVTGRGATIGTPGLRAGSEIEIGGLGTVFNGRYFVKSTTHTIGPRGYITEFEARLEENNT
jgi:phage protein D